MSTIFDILGATIIGGIVLLIIINLNIYSNQIKYTSDSDVRLQGNTKALADIIDYDLRKVGYNYKGVAITEALSNKFSFYSDIDSNGTVKLVTLTDSDSTKAAFTSNPHDRLFYYIINNDTSKAALGLTNFKLTYMNSLGNPTTALDSIKVIKAEIWLESAEMIDTHNKRYAKTYWEITVNPRNL